MHKSTVERGRKAVGEAATWVLTCLVAAVFAILLLDSLTGEVSDAVIASRVSAR